MHNVLVVDDRSEARAVVASELEDAGFAVHEAEDGVAGWRAFQDASPDLVITDLRMPRADGFDLLRRIRQVSRVPIIMLTAYGDVPTAVTAMKDGAQEFLTFPDDLERMIARVKELVAPAPAPPGAEADIAGRSAAMRSVRDRVRALAPLSVPVLVSGEPGTGRDHVVSALQAGRGRELVVVRGDQVVNGRRGAPDVDVYLDEVGRLDGDAQRHWLSWLRANPGNDGATTRLFASTSEDLASLARHGEFDPELVERLQRFTIHLAPLRERSGDVQDLVAALLARSGTELGRPDVKMQPSGLAALRAHGWPGNVRELAACLEKLVAFSHDGAIGRKQVEEVLERTPHGVASARERRERKQRAELRLALEECEGNLAEVSRRLGIARATVIYRAQKFGLLPRRRRLRARREPATPEA